MSPDVFRDIILPLYLARLIFLHRKYVKIVNGTAHYDLGNAFHTSASPNSLDMTLSRPSSAVAYSVKHCERLYLIMFGEAHGSPLQTPRISETVVCFIGRNVNYNLGIVNALPNKRLMRKLVMFIPA